MIWVQVARQWLEADRASESREQVTETETHRASLDVVAARLYRDLMDGLSPMLGVGGVGLIFARSLKLTSARFPFIEEVFTLDGSAAMADHLCLALSMHDEETAEEATVALFATFMGLLETFLGAALATRLVSEIRPATSAGAHAAEEST